MVAGHIGKEAVSAIGILFIPIAEWLASFYTTDSEWLAIYTDWIVRGIMYCIRIRGVKWIKHRLS